MVKNPASSAADQGSTRGWQSKIPSATGQLDPLQVTREEPEHHNGDQSSALSTPKKKKNKNSIKTDNKVILIKTYSRVSGIKIFESSKIHIKTLFQQSFKFKGKTNALDK